MTKKAKRTVESTEWEVFATQYMQALNEKFKLRSQLAALNNQLEDLHARNDRAADRIRDQKSDAKTPTVTQPTAVAGPSNVPPPPRRITPPKPATPPPKATPQRPPSIQPTAQPAQPEPGPSTAVPGGAPLKPPPKLTDNTPSFGTSPPPTAVATPPPPKPPATPVAPPTTTASTSAPTIYSSTPSATPPATPGTSTYPKPARRAPSVGKSRKDQPTPTVLMEELDRLRNRYEEITFYATMIIFTLFTFLFVKELRGFCSKICSSPPTFLGGGDCGAKVEKPVELELKLEEVKNTACEPPTPKPGLRVNPCPGVRPATAPPSPPPTPPSTPVSPPPQQRITLKAMPPAESPPIIEAKCGGMQDLVQPKYDCDFCNSMLKNDTMGMVS